MMSVYTYTVCPRKLCTFNNSFAHVTQYPIHILEFCLREIDDPIVWFDVPKTESINM